MNNLSVTSLDEIRAQAAPQVIEIPGFKKGTTIKVAVRVVDLTPHLLEAGIGNPLLAVVRGKGEGEGEGQERDVSVARLLPVLDAITKSMLACPTYDEIVAICPLTLDQKLTLAAHALGGIQELASFRGESGV